MNLDFKTSAELVGNKAVHQHIQKCVDEANSKSVSRAAHIKKFVLLSGDFSQDGGELTPTMKLKRKVTEQKYSQQIEDMYKVEAKM